jgi:exopolysaccharide biosynthesis polyprenyl glycosylphosphotransferase
MARAEQSPPPPQPAVGAAVAKRVKRWPLLRRLLAMADALAVLLTALVVLSTHGAIDGVYVAATTPLWLVVAKIVGLYDRDQRSLRHETLDELPALVTWAAVGTAMVVAAMLVTRGMSPHASAAIVIGVTSWGTVLILRNIARIGWRGLTPPERMLLVGEAVDVADIVRKLERFAAIHVTVSDIRPELTRDDLITPQPWLAQVERILISTDLSDPELLALLLAYCRRHQIRLSLVAPMRGLFGSAARLDRIADLPFIEYDTWHVPRSTLFIKRCMDLAIASVVAVVTLPVIAITAAAIVVDDGRPVLFTQLRAGRNGKPFRMLKFRTMVRGAEQMRGVERLPDPAVKLRDDPRVTRVGRVLRRWSLDELPQLVNILRGDMSLVGPRPEQVELVARYDEEHLQRLAVRPGLTGPMQVYGRGSLRLDERLALERDYIETMSLRRDLRILTLTLAAIASGRGAY